jgi:hypothetical protein
MFSIRLFQSFILIQMRISLTGKQAIKLSIILMSEPSFGLEQDVLNTCLSLVIPSI